MSNSENTSEIVERLQAYAEGAETNDLVFDVENCGSAIRAVARFWTTFPGARENFQIDIWLYDFAEIRVSRETREPGIQICTSDSRCYPINPM